jgi:hypothetical protein
MYLAAAVLMLTSALPLGWAWQASQRTTLSHALAWATLAWLAWLGLALAVAGGVNVPVAACYGAVCLTGCAGIAVLGARRPGVVAWHFVVFGLLTILMLPLAEGFGELDLRGPRIVFLAAVLAVGFLNYLPTRLLPMAALLTGICGAEVWSMAQGTDNALRAWEFMAVGAAPWAAFVSWRWRRPTSEFDLTWQALRDGFGALWAERTRQQFNRAAANAGLSGRLGWGGLRAAPPAEHEQLLVLLHALLKRFGPPE